MFGKRELTQCSVKSLIKSNSQQTSHSTHSSQGSKSKTNSLATGHVSATKPSSSQTVGIGIKSRSSKIQNLGLTKFGSSSNASCSLSSTSSASSTSSSSSFSFDSSTPSHAHNNSSEHFGAKHAPHFMNNDTSIKSFTNDSTFPVAGETSSNTFSRPQPSEMFDQSVYHYQTNFSVNGDADDEYYSSISAIGRTPNATNAYGLIRDANQSDAQYGFQKYFQDTTLAHCSANPTSRTLSECDPSTLPPNYQYLCNPSASLTAHSQLVRHTHDPHFASEPYSLSDHAESTCATVAAATAATAANSINYQYMRLNGAFTQSGTFTSNTSTSSSNNNESTNQADGSMLNGGGGLSQFYHSTPHSDSGNNNYTHSMPHTTSNHQSYIYNYNSSDAKYLHHHHHPHSHSHHHQHQHHIPNHFPHQHN